MRHAEALWRMLDEIGTLDEQGKSDDDTFRRKARAIAGRRFEHAVAFDGHFLRWKDVERWNWAGPSKYRGDPDRPYTGQDHQGCGEFGKNIVPPMTLRDLGDLVREALDEYPWHFGSGEPDLEALTQNIIAKVGDELRAHARLVEA